VSERKRERKGEREREREKEKEREKKERGREKERKLKENPQRVRDDRFWIINILLKPSGSSGMGSSFALRLDE